MAIRESFQFSTDYITLVIEHVRTITRFVKKEAGITYSEYVLLVLLLDTAKPLQAADLGDYIGLKTRAITVSLLDLEDRGYITKENDQRDHRIMLIRLRQEVQHTVQELIGNVEAYVQSRFWNGLSVGEFESFREGMDHTLDNLRGHSVPSVQHCLTHETVIYPEFYVVWRMCEDMWSSIAFKVGEMSLRDCRILLLVRQVGTISPSDAVDSLDIDRAGVTLAKRSLIEHGLIKETALESDSRKIIIECTKSGAAMADKLLTELRRATEKQLGSGTGEELMLINSWSMKMYRNQRLPRMC